MNRLYRSHRDRVLLGVCGGIGHYLGVDPVIIRVAWVLLSLTPFPGVLAYLVAALVMPAEPRPVEAGGGPGAGGGAAAGADADGGTPPAGEDVAAGEAPPGGEPPAAGRREATLKVTGLVLVAVGAFLLVYNLLLTTELGRAVRRYLLFPPFDWRLWARIWTTWWPVLLVLLGAVILWRGGRGTR